MWHGARRQWKPNTDLIWKAYRENLELVLPYAHEIDKKLDGKAVITSDHGNLVGKRNLPLPTRTFGHPSWRHVPPLIKVPWYELKYNKRRDIVAETPITDQKRPEQPDIERLEALGYK